MTRLPYLPWCQAIARILGSGYECPTHDLELMWQADPQVTPVEAAAAIAIGLFEKEINR